MSLRFEETMAGSVVVTDVGTLGGFPPPPATEPAGPSPSGSHAPAGERRFSFTGRAASSTVLAMVGWAPLRLEGTAHLEGVVEAAPLLAGSQLEIGPPLHRYLRYQVHFEDGDGHRYRFFGQKTVFVLRLRQTMTTLVGTLHRDGVEVGPATLRFDLRELPRFLGSFSLQPG